ncbi:MAG: rRNA maturation RNase YbeY [candidate division Zixibacteria bacterium]|nr:rRNA maturation RNase YbeY [candidate division Zixibacteria bacterium]
MNTYAKVTIHNIHPISRIKKKEIEKLISRMLRAEGVSLPVDVIFVDDDFMRKINRKFTRRRKTTDVLSFGMKEGKNMGVDYPSLGDIYVSLDQAKRQAQEYRISLKEETSRLVIHGLLHLLGYDHKGKKEAEIMKQKEEAYLN